MHADDKKKRLNVFFSFFVIRSFSRLCSTFFFTNTVNTTEQQRKKGIRKRKMQEKTDEKCLNVEIAG